MGFNIWILGNIVWSIAPYLHIATHSSICCKLLALISLSSPLTIVLGILEALK